MKLLFLHGPAASGKHTIGRILSAKTGIPLFHNHLTVDLVGTMFEFGSKPFVKLREQIWLSTFSIAAESGQSLIFTFAPERTVDPSFIESARGIVENRGGEVVFIELICNESTLLQRMGNDSRSCFGKLTDKDLYIKLKAEGQFSFPKLPVPLTRIDTATATPEEAARNIEQALEMRD